jgi:hypothetical protein
MCHSPLNIGDREDFNRSGDYIPERARLGDQSVRDLTIRARGLLAVEVFSRHGQNSSSVVAG